MLTMKNRSFSVVAGLFVLLYGVSLRGQETSQNLQKVRQESIAGFENGDFRSALSGFRRLMDLDPGNAMHSYHAGICMVELNEELDRAIELLYGASKRGVPSDVSFYLGMAYQRNYNFAVGIRYFNRFEVNASRQELKEYNVKHYISSCRSAKELTATYNPYEVLNVTFLDLFDSLQFSQIKMKGGELQRKPDSYFQEDEDRKGLTSLMFIPPKATRGRYLYYAGYGRSSKQGAQLFRVKKGVAKAWNDPEEIKALNSDGDEIMPYFDPIGNDLYFASNGRSGIGGYDLYKTHYDSERDEWTEPINLGFPINSAMDEYLFLPGSDLGMVMFFTNRQGTDSTVTVYRLHLVEPKKKTGANDFTMLKEIAHLGGVASEILVDLEDMAASDEDQVSDDGVAVDKRSADQAQPEITAVKILSEPPKKSAYQKTLAEALRHQAVSDSLKDLATSARIKVRESDDPNDRWVWQKQIMLWEKKARDQESLADALYAQMEEERVASQKNPAVSIPETIEVDRVIDDLTVYRYTPGSESTVTTDIGGEPGTPPAPTYPSSTKANSEPVSESVINRFDILGQSPYSATNPIPIDVVLPGGIFYRIQLGAFSTAVEPEAFQGISPVTGERLADRGLIKYYAGKFSRYQNASEALTRVRSNGYEDAFVVAWYNGTPITTQRAKQLE